MIPVGFPLKNPTNDTCTGPSLGNDVCRPTKGASRSHSASSKHDNRCVLGQVFRGLTEGELITTNGIESSFSLMKRGIIVSWHKSSVSILRPISMK